MNSENSASTRNAKQLGSLENGRDNLPQVTFANARKPVQRLPVAAVIRPIQRVEGTERSIRLDAADTQPVRAPHMRNNNLDDYVKWLKDQAKKEPAATVPRSQRSDQAHAEPGLHQAAPAPNVLPADFNFEADLERILAKLNMPEVIRNHSGAGGQVGSGLKASLSPALANQTSNVKPATTVKPLPVSNVADNQFNSDEIIRTVSQAIASVLTNGSEAEIETKIRSQLSKARSVSTPPRNSAPPVIETNHAQHTISTGAPARPHVTEIRPAREHGSVETPARNFTPPITETKHVQPHMGSSVTPARPHVAETRQAQPAATVAQPKVSSVAQPQVSKEAPKFSPKVAAKEAQATQPATQDIPLEVAAWDVEEFRWPKVTEHMLNAGAAAIKELGHSMVKSLLPGENRVAIISPGRGEGTTSIAISLARWVAANGGRVLLVDADLASPGLSSIIGLGPNISWINAVQRSQEVAEVIIRAQESKICVMPMSPIVGRATKPRFLLDGLSDLIDRIESSFDLVLFDIGPASQLLAELSQPQLLVDVGLIVHNGLSLANFRQTQDRLQEFGLTQMVVAQNGVHPAAAQVA